MLREAQRWQYPARVGPVQEVALPTLDWLVQHPDPTRRPPELVHEQCAFTRLVVLSEKPIDWLVQHPDPLPNPPRDVAVAAAGEAATQQPGFPIPPTSYASPTSIVLDGGVVQVQARAEPVYAEAPPVVPDIGWLVQQPDPVRRPLELVHEQFAFTRLVELSEIPIDWAVEHPDPVRRPPELVQEQFSFLRLVELSEIPIGWLVQHPDPVRRLPELVSEGYFVHRDEHESLIPSLDWFLQHPDPVLPLPVPPSESVLVEFHVPVPPEVPDIDFIVQHPDPLPKPPPTHTEPELAFEHEDLIPPPDWLVQHPEPLPPPERLVPEAFAFEFEHELLIPSIDWLQQLPDPIQELRRPSTEPVGPEMVEVPPPPIVFDWLVQHPDPVLPEKPRQDWYVRVDEMVEIPVETWLQPPSEPVRLPIQLVRFHGELFLVEFAVPPGVGIPYVFRECQALWEIIHPQFWESAVLPSGYIPPPEYVPVPSGYIAVEGGTAPWDMVR